MAHTNPRHYNLQHPAYLLPVVGLNDKGGTELTLSSFELFLLGDGEKKITEQIFTGKMLLYASGVVLGY